VPAFSVSRPQGKGWKVAISPDSQGIQFRHEKKGFLDFSTPELTTIAVLLNSTTPENAARGTDSVAKDFMDQEEAQIRAGPEDLKHVRRGTDSVGPYHLYVFEPRSQITTALGYVQSDQRLYIYFPPDFGSRNQFFLFLITKIHPPKNIFESRSFDAILPVIQSFRDERPPAAEVSLSTASGSRGVCASARATGDIATR
jgi:hypothetical protein